MRTLVRGLSKGAASDLAHIAHQQGGAGAVTISVGAWYLKGHQSLLIAKGDLG